MSQIQTNEYQKKLILWYGTFCIICKTNMTLCHEMSLIQMPLHSVTTFLSWRGVKIKTEVTHMILSGLVIKNDPREYFRNIYESLPSDWTSELSQWEMSLPISPTFRCHGLLRLKDVSEQMGPSYPFKQRGRPVIWPRVLASWPCQSSKWHYDPMPQEMCSINPNSASYQFNTVNKPQSSCHDWM